MRIVVEDSADFVVYSIQLLEPCIDPEGEVNTKHIQSLRKIFKYGIIGRVTVLYRLSNKLYFRYCLTCCSIISKSGHNFST